MSDERWKGLPHPPPPPQTPAFHKKKKKKEEEEEEKGNPRPQSSPAFIYLLLFKKN